MAKITNAFLDGMASGINQKQETKNQTDSNFSKTFGEYAVDKTKAEKPVKKDYIKTAKPKLRDMAVKKDSVKTDDANKDNTAKTDASKTASTKAETKTTETTKTEKAEAVVSSVSSEDKIAMDESIISSIAQSLNMTADDVKLILSDLEHTATDLLDKGNLNLFLQKANDVENPVELLNIPEINQTFQNLVETIENTIIEYEKAEQNTEITAKEAFVPVESTEYVAAAPTAEKTNQTETAPTADTDITAKDTAKAVNTEAVRVNPQEATNNAKGEAQNFNQNTDGEQAENITGLNVGVGTVADFKTAAGYQFRTEQTRNIDQHQVVTQIIEKIKVDIKSDVSEIKLILKPEALGEVSLKIASENGIITAQFTAQSQKVKEILESNMNTLKEALTEQGINISEFSVNVSHGDAERQMNEFKEGRSKSQGRINSIINNIAAEEAGNTENNVNVKEALKSKVDYAI